MPEAPDPQAEPHGDHKPDPKIEIVGGDTPVFLTDHGPVQPGEIVSDVEVTNSVRELLDAGAITERAAENYDDSTVKELVDELDRRGVEIDANAKKKDLVDALRADDANPSKEKS